jgi:hypothetical protein
MRPSKFHRPYTRLAPSNADRLQQILLILYNYTLMKMKIELNLEIYKNACAGHPMLIYNI